MPRSKSRTATTAARRRRSTASRPRKQRGGSRTVLPISYFGGDDSAAYTGKCGRSPIQTAYGGSLPTSFGELGTSLGADFAGPNLAPGSGVDGVSASALQTGGARRRRKSARRKSVRRQPTRRSRARRSRRTRTQRGGGGQYGRTVMPIKYYGGDDSKAYGAPCGRSSFDTSYGRSVPTSFGGSAPELAGGFRGPNLAPGGMGEAFAVTGIQTGGGRNSRGGSPTSTSINRGLPKGHYAPDSKLFNLGQTVQVVNVPISPFNGEIGTIKSKLNQPRNSYQVEFENFGKRECKADKLKSVPEHSVAEAEALAPDSKLFNLDQKVWNLDADSSSLDSRKPPPPTPTPPPRSPPQSNAEAAQARHRTPYSEVHYGKDTLIKDDDEWVRAGNIKTEEADLDKIAKENRQEEAQHRKAVI